MFAMNQLMMKGGRAMCGSMVATKMTRVRFSPTCSNQNLRARRY
jgi:hypothetical protein